MPEDKVFAFIVDGDVFGTLHIPASVDSYDRLVAGFSSGASVVDATDTPGVKFGWTYNGSEFVPPSE